MATSQTSGFTRRALMAAIPAAAIAAPQTPSTRSVSLEDRLFAAFGQMEIIDSHEHTQSEEARVAKPFDFFRLADGYLASALRSAGQDSEASKLMGDERASMADRWRAFEPAWKFVRFTGYGELVHIAVRDIYGVEEISAANLGRINDAIQAKNKPGLYRHIFKEKMRMRFAVLDDYWKAQGPPADAEFWVLARRFDRFVTPAELKAVQALEKLTNVSITTLAGMKQALERSFSDNLKVGMRVVKSGLAYDRDLDFRETLEADAARDFERLMRSNEKPVQGYVKFLRRPFRSLEDHMFHQVVRLIEAYGLPMQIHTGILAGNKAILPSTRAAQLSNLFYLYPKVKFDLFHIGYPYQDELVAMAKLFPNLYLDFNWAHIISPSASRRTLYNCLDTIPANKVLGYGGDSWHPELSYGQLKIAQRNIAAVLARRVEEKFCTEQDALELGKMLLLDNPQRLYQPQAA